MERTISSCNIRTPNFSTSLVNLLVSISLRSWLLCHSWLWLVSHLWLWLESYLWLWLESYLRLWLESWVDWLRVVNRLGHAWSHVRVVYHGLVSLDAFDDAEHNADENQGW